MFKVWFKVYGLEYWQSSKSVSYETEQKAIEAAREKFDAWTQAQSWVVMPEGINPNAEDQHSLGAKFSAPRGIA